MAYKSKKVATCPCGTGDTHSLRQAGICDGLRNGKLDQAQGAALLAQLAAGNSDDRRRRGEPTHVEPAPVQPESAV